MSAAETEPVETRGIAVVHCRQDTFDVYGGRGTNGANVRTTIPGDRGWLGNPHEVTDACPRELAIARFAKTFLGRLAMDPQFRRAIHGLDGQRVACWCRSAEDTEPACHLDVIDAFLRGGRAEVREFLTQLGVAIREDGSVVWLDNPVREGEQ